MFCSRAHLHKRGGDIDLHIEVFDFDAKKIYEQSSQFWILLQDRLGEQKIDIVIKDPKQDLLGYKIARQEGVEIL